MARRTSREAARRRQDRLYTLVGLLVLVVVLLLVFSWLWRLLDQQAPKVAPVAEQCVARVGDMSTSLDLEQSGNAAIIVSESIRRGLPARAASIALATAMQESGLRNIDYGDRDSVGLFQQRTSQGWGTIDQIMDPWYSAGKFYEHLVKVPGWQSGDINDVAQKVQRSGVPDGYRKHVEQARAWGSALTGHSPASISCVDRGTSAPSAAGGVAMLKKAFGNSVKVTTAQGRVQLNSSDQTRLWAATQLLQMTTGTTGIAQVEVGQQTWTGSGTEVAAWGGTASAKPTEAVVTLRA